MGSRVRGAGRLSTSQLLRRGLETRVGEPVRAQLWLRQATRDQFAVSQASVTSAYQRLSLRSAEDHNDLAGATAFVLGSGESILSLQPKQFDVIASNYSIGINAWALHKFVPNLYFFETHRNGGQPGGDSLYLSGLLREERVRRANPSLLLLRPNKPSTFAHLVQPPDWLRAKTFVYGRANLITRRTQNIEQDIHRIFDFFLAGQAPQSVLPDNGASVVRAVFLCALRGAHKIVLAGVDLNSAPYFWQADKALSQDPHVQQFFSRPVGTPHSTLSANNRPFSTLTFLIRLAHVLKNRFGISVELANEKSSLNQALPLYDWRI